MNHKAFTLLLGLLLTPLLPVEAKVEEKGGIEGITGVNVEEEPEEREATKGRSEIRMPEIPLPLRPIGRLAYLIQHLTLGFLSNLILRRQIDWEKKILYWIAMQSIQLYFIALRLRSCDIPPLGYLTLLPGLLTTILSIFLFKFMETYQSFNDFLEDFRRNPPLHLLIPLFIFNSLHVLLIMILFFIPEKSIKGNFNQSLKHIDEKKKREQDKSKSNQNRKDIPLSMLIQKG